MRKRGKEKEQHFEIQVCPLCLSPKVCKVPASSGDMTGDLAILPPKFMCPDCGWIGRLVIMRRVGISNNDSS